MAAVVDDVQKEIRLEHQRIVYPLLDRMIQVAGEVPDEVDYPLEYLQEGLGLLNRYLTTLRDRWITDVFVLLGREAGGDSSVLQIHQFQKEQPVERDQIVALEDLVKGVRERRFQARWRLGITLRNDALAEKAWTEEEERFAGRCLAQKVEPSTGRTLHDTLEKLRPRAAELAEEVQSYVARPVNGLAPASPRRGLPSSSLLADSRAAGGRREGDASATDDSEKTEALINRPSAFRAGKVLNPTGPL